jgi:hypothetical protein
MSWVGRAAGYGVVEFENRGSNGVGIHDMQPMAAAIDHVFTNVNEAAQDGPRQLRGHESIDAAVNYRYWARVLTCGGRVFMPSLRRSWAPSTAQCNGWPPSAYLHPRFQGQEPPAFPGRFIRRRNST